MALSEDTEYFHTYKLTRNHRSHISIINYSARLLSSSYKPLSFDRTRVYYKSVDGSEIEIAHWLNTAVPFFSDQYQIIRKKIGILVRGKRSANIIHRHIDFPHKPVITTSLDTDSSLWGAIFRKIMNWAFNDEITKYELVEEYLSMDLQLAEVRKVISLLKRIEQIAHESPSKLGDYINLFVGISKIIFPRRRNKIAIKKLTNVLSKKVLLESYIPPCDDEVQLMTLHKAKGLEFDVVFHLDLYKWIFPMYRGDRIQDLNLHYVGITRAKEHCILCTSTLRHNRQGIRDAEDSDFLHGNNLSTYRTECPV
jgi:DNA helicase-2/ATP-dependent DNA helicase PcrA